MWCLRRNLKSNCAAYVIKSLRTHQKALSDNIQHFDNWSTKWINWTMCFTVQRQSFNFDLFFFFFDVLLGVFPLFFLWVFLLFHFLWLNKIYIIFVHPTPICVCMLRLAKAFKSCKQHTLKKKTLVRKKYLESDISNQAFILFYSAFVFTVRIKTKEASMVLLHLKLCWFLFNQFGLLTCNFTLLTSTRLNCISLTKFILTTCTYNYLMFLVRYL